MVTDLPEDELHDTGFDEWSRQQRRFETKWHDK